MDVFQSMEIKKYFYLDERISKIRDKIHQLENEFYNQSFTPQTFASDGEVYNVGFNIEKSVIKYLDTVLVLERSINRLQIKKQFFDKFLSEINYSDRLYLINKYKGKNTSSKFNELDVKVYNEILEIEEAIKHMYGFPIVRRDDWIEDTKNVSKEVNNIAKLLGV